jgi:flagellar FliL protein
MSDARNTPVNASLDEEEEEAFEEQDGGEGLSAKKLLLFVVLPLLIIGGGAGAYLTGTLDSFLGSHEEGETQMAESKKHGEANLNAAFLKIPDMIVNLSSNDAQPRYLRLSVQLELRSEEDKAKIEQVMPRVVDQFQTYLRELRVRDLRGSAGIYRLQMELLSRVNAAAYPVEVQDVLFQIISPG